MTQRLLVALLGAILMTSPALFGGQSGQPGSVQPQCAGFLPVPDHGVETTPPRFKGFPLLGVVAVAVIDPGTRGPPSRWFMT